MIENLNSEGVGGSNLPKQVRNRLSSPTNFQKTEAKRLGFFVMGYFAYILYSPALDRYYIGSTEEVTVRLKEHIWKHRGFTARAKDWQLKYSEPFASRTEALKRERQIKKWKSRTMIEKLIASQK